VCLHIAPSFCCLYQLPVSPLNESASGVVDAYGVAVIGSERSSASCLEVPVKVLESSQGGHKTRIHEI